MVVPKVESLAVKSGGLKVVQMVVQMADHWVELTVECSVASMVA